MIAPSLIVATARTYLNTPFLHQGRVKGHGVDCVGLVLCVAGELGIEAAPAPENYGRSPDGVTLQREIEARMVRVADMQLGDVLLMAIAGDPQHVGFVADYVHGGFSLIHAHGALRNGREHGRCTEHRLDALWLSRVRGIYRFREVMA